MNPAPSTRPQQPDSRSSPSPSAPGAPDVPGAPDAPPAGEPQPGFLRVVGMVLSAFIGIRKRSAAEAAHRVIKPAHVVVAGIIGALVFIALLVTLVRFIISR